MRIRNKFRKVPAPHPNLYLNLNLNPAPALNSSSSSEISRPPFLNSTATQASRHITLRRSSHVAQLVQLNLSVLITLQAYLR